MDLSTDTLNLYSIAGVIACTFAIVEIAKRYIQPNTMLGKIPIIFFPLVISPILALCANKLLKRSDGTPFLAGNTWTVLGRAFLGASSASGFFTWIKKPTVTVGDAKPLGTGSGIDKTMKPTLLILASFMFLGCACPEKAALRETMDQGTRTIRQNEADWAAKLVAYPVGTTDPRTGLPSTGKNQADKIPPLTPAQFKQEQAAQKGYNDLVNEDRAKDSQKGLFGTSSTPAAPAQ